VLRHGLLVNAGGKGQDGERPFVPPAWLGESHRDPEAFWRTVGPVLLAGPGGSARSSLFDRYNLFHELGARHAGRRMLGYVEPAPGAGFVESSYASLVERAACLATAWKDRGVEPGATVALLAPLSAEAVVAWLAGFRCGAVVAPVPAFGRAFMRNRLEALKPDFVATGAGRAAWLRLDPETTLPLVADDDVRPDSAPAYAYASDEPAARFFSPLGRDPLAVHELTAHQLLLGALRDGVLLLSLDAGDTVAAPGFCDTQEKPPLLLATLAAGACWLEVGLESAASEPDEMLGRATVVGVHDDLRDAWLTARPRTRLARWFRNPAGPPAYEAWDRFAAQPFAERALGSNLFVNGAAGGAIACGAWRHNPGRNQILLAPGQPWRLASASLRSTDALGASGVLACAGETLPADAIGRIVAVRAGGEYIWVTCLDAHRRAQRLPSAEICAAVTRAHSEVWRCALVDYAKDDGGLANGAALVVFLRPDREPLSARDVADTIAQEIGEQFQPDRTDFFDVPARTTKEGDLDLDWCRSHYADGLLALKQRERLFRGLGRLRYLLAEEELDG
jgi:acyl-CoA synthetase (AMP-forming)/AMP-acid ligase II